MRIQGSTFELRPWTLDDVDSLIKYANNEKIAMNLRDGFPNPYTRSDADAWIKMVLSNKKDLIFAIDIKGVACGGIGLHGGKDVYRFNAEIGYWLAEDYWGKGICTEATGLLVDYGFTNYHWTRIFAGVFSTNPASMRVLLKNGFVHEASFHASVKKRGKYLDEHVYSILKSKWLKLQG